MAAFGTFLTIRFDRAPRSERPVRVGPFLTQWRHSCIAANYPSFDHFVGGRQECGRHGEAERLRCLEIDSQIEFGWQEDGNVDDWCRTLAPVIGKRRVDRLTGQDI